MEREPDEKPPGEQAPRSSRLGLVRLPAACAVICATGFLYAWLMAYAVCPDLVGQSDWQFRVMAVPFMLLLGGVWALVAWRIGAKFFTITLALLSLAWGLLIVDPPIEALWIALIAASTVCAAGIGGAAERIRGTALRTAAGTSAGVCAVLGAAAGSFLMFYSILAEASRDVIAVMAVFLIWAGTTIPLLVGAWAIGWRLPGVWTASKGVRRVSLVWPLLPILAIVPAIIAISVFMSALNDFQRNAAPALISVIDKEIVRFSMYSPQVSLAGPGDVYVSVPGQGDKNGSVSLLARMPVHWTPKVGLRAPVVIESLEYDTFANAPRSPERKLRDRAGLEKFLVQVGARAAVRNAAWRREPPGSSYPQFGPRWIATCRVGGAELTMRAFEGGRLIIESRD